MDTCSIAHLMCVADSAHLIDKITNENVRISAIVKGELKELVKRKKTITSDNKRRDEVNKILTTLHRYINEHDEQLMYSKFDEKRQLSFNIITNHDGENNGEYASTLLCLNISRNENQKVTFVTDDYKASDAFREYFNFQQIGEIIDTADYLIYQYWLSNIKAKKDLLSCLRNLRSEYTTEINEIITELERVSKAAKSLKDRQVAVGITDLISSIKTLNKIGIDTTMQKIDQIGGVTAREVIRLMDKIKAIEFCKQAEKISKYIKMIDMHEIIQKNT